MDTAHRLPTRALECRRLDGGRSDLGPLLGGPGEYLARWSSQFFGATYAVQFPDSILGALALNTFAEMLRRHYDARCIRFELTGTVTPRLPSGANVTWLVPGCR